MKQWWIKQGTYTGESYAKDPFYSTVMDSEPEDKGFIHVVEYAEYERLKTELEKLQRLLSGEVVEMDCKEPSYVATVKLDIT